MSFKVLSPDGLPIAACTYPSSEAAQSAIRRWVKRFEPQGYYATASGIRIPIDLIHANCRIEPVAPFQALIRTEVK
jgi:hypothetical protein